MRIVNVIGDTVPFEEFSKMLLSYVQQPNIDGVLYYNYTDYSGMYVLDMLFVFFSKQVAQRVQLSWEPSLMFVHHVCRNGQIVALNGKPVIGARYKLWQGFDTPETLAAKLNSASTDAHSADGYSLIAVHAWSMKCVV